MSNKYGFLTEIRRFDLKIIKISMHLALIYNSAATSNATFRFYRLLTSEWLITAIYEVASNKNEM